MGWLFFHGKSKEDLIKDLVKGWENDCGENNVNHAKSTCLKHTAHGNRLWAVFERILTEKATGKVLDSQRYVMLFLLAKDPSCDGYGYKDIDESMGPNYYDCPMNYIEMSPLPKNIGEMDFRIKWREGVKEYWKFQKEKNKHGKEISATLKVGDKIKIAGCVPDTFTITRIDGKDVTGFSGYVDYRIKPKHLKKAVIIPKEENAAVA